MGNECLTTSVDFLSAIHDDTKAKASSKKTAPHVQIYICKAADDMPYDHVAWAFVDGDFVASMHCEQADTGDLVSALQSGFNKDWKVAITKYAIHCPPYLVEYGHVKEEDRVTYDKLKADSLLKNATGIATPRNGTTHTTATAAPRIARRRPSSPPPMKRRR